MGNRKLLQRSLWAGPTGMAEESATIEIRCPPQGPRCSLVEKSPRALARLSEDTKFNVRKPSKTLGGTQILRELVRSRFTK